MRRRLPLVLVLTTAACAARMTTPDTDGSPSPSPVSVVVLGSSTAAGWMLDDAASESWVARYAVTLAADAPGSVVTNLAVPGFTTRAILAEGASAAAANNITAALALDPDAILVNLPSNDAALGVPIDETMDNLHAVVDLARARGVRTGVTTSQPRNVSGDARDALIAMRTRVTAEFSDDGDLALDFWTPLATQDGTILAELDAGDGVHVNAEGHRRLADVAAASATVRWVRTGSR